MKVSVGCINRSDAYALHLKATATSWAIQCSVAENVRAGLAHHRKTGNARTVQLYSRDDVWGALVAQRMIILEAARGWRPLPPPGTGGGQQPLKEPVVALPGPPLDWDLTPRVADLPGRITVATSLDSVPPMTVNTGARDGILPIAQWAQTAVPVAAAGPKRPKLDMQPDESDSSTDSADDDAGGHLVDSGADQCFVCNTVSGIGHFATILHTPCTRALDWELEGARVYLRPRCGAQCDLAVDTYVVAADLPARFEPCKRLGCRASGSQWGSLGG